MLQIVEKIQPKNHRLNEFKNHIDSALNKADSTPHGLILNELTQQIGQIDFLGEAFPQTKELREKMASMDKTSEEYADSQKTLEKYKLNTKHYLVLSVENTIKAAQQNSWGLCKKHDFIYLYNGAYWNEIEKEEFQQFLGEASEKMGVAKFSARFYQFREQLFKQFLATAYLPTPDPDKSLVNINLKNGTFEISHEGTKLRPFKPSDFLTYQLPFDYNPEAKSPIFEAYLSRVLPDTDRQKVLAEYIGYVFIKHGSKTLKEEKALILYGTGANGKSVFFEVINALFGDENVSNYSLHSLTNENGYYRAKIANKLVNYASEISTKLDSTFFKQMVSGEPVEARMPYGEAFTLTQYAKFIFNCNELPKDVEHTNAYFRRFLIIPFDVTIPAQEQDRNLHSKIIENELSGVFNWVLDGLNRLLAQGHFSECEAANKALEKYRIESDSVQMFLQENEYSISITEEIPLKDIFAEYRGYSFDNGFKPCSNKTFSERLKNIGYTIEKKNFGRVVNAKK